MNPTPRYRQASALLGGLIGFGVAGIGMHALRPAASYRALELGANPLEVGLIGASFSLMAVFFAIPVGHGIDRFGHRWFFLAGTLVMFIGASTGALAHSLVLLAVCQLLVGLGWVTAAISYQTATANRRNSNRDQAFALLAIAASVAQLVGPLVAGFVLNLGNSNDALPSGSALTLMASAGFSVVAFLLALCYLRANDSSKNDTQRVNTAGKYPVGTIVRREGVLRALGVGVVVQAARDLMVVYLPLVGDERGLDPGTVGILLGLSGAGGLASRIALPSMLALAGRRRLLLAAVTLGATASLVVVFASSIWLLAPTLFSFGYALGLGAPLTMAWISTQVPRNERGIALAMRMTGVRIGLVIFPTALGAVAALTGPGGVFLITAGILASSTTLLRHRLAAGR